MKSDYRKEKRIISFINPKTKQTIIKTANKNGRSLSNEVKQTLEKAYGGNS